jgi:chromosome segregation ATPase
MGKINLKEAISIMSALSDITVEQANSILNHAGLAVSDIESIDDLVTAHMHVSGGLSAQKKICDDQQKVIQKQQSQLALKENEIKRLQGICDSSGSMSAYALKNKLAEKDGEMGRLRDKIKSLAKELESVNRAAARKNQYKMQVEQLTRDIEALSAALEDSICRARLYKHNIDAYKEQVRQLKEQVEFLKFDNDTYLKANDILRAEVLKAEELIINIPVGVKVTINRV